MSNTAKPIPAGYHTVTPHLVVNGAAKALDFYKTALGASELDRVADPSGKIMHAEVQIGDSRVMLCDEFPQMNARGPQALGGTPVSLYVYVEDADAVVARAAAAGAKVMYAVNDKFYGDRCGVIQDPFGHIWNIATHKEDVSMDQIRERMAAMSCGGKKGAG